MKKIVIAPDSFKGTLSSSDVCSIMKKCVLNHFPDCHVDAFPIADGGEGSVACFIEMLGGKLVFLNCSGPHFTPVAAAYAILPEERNGFVKTAVIELASAAGLSLAGERKDPSSATTYGVGELISAALADGCQKIILGLGGSCTNDFGCGAAAALGMRFLDSSGKEFIPTGASLCDINIIDTSHINDKLADTEILVMCDVDNPVYGKNGAAHTFAAQKGADEDMIKLLDCGLIHICSIVRDQLGIDVSTLPGGGAAGAAAAGMFAFFGARLVSGIDTVLDTIGFDDIIKDADIIFTGEGLLDSQSLHGKVISGVGKRAESAGVPCVAVVGGVKDSEINEIYNRGISAVFSINRLPLDLSVSSGMSAENLSSEFDNILRLIKVSRSLTDK